MWAIPYGLGAGAVDAALNNYVALHYASRHMSWLHCFWGVGASISPYIMGYFLGTKFGWQGGYRAVSVIQIVLTIALFSSLQLWRNKKVEIDRSEKVSRPLSVVQAVRIRGVPFILIAFFGYCALETTTGLWASSYLVEHRGVDVETAAMFASLFYLGITFGRFLNGFVAERFGDRKLIRYGVTVMIVGVSMVGIPLETDVLALAGLIVIGLGCAPVYPSIIHATPSNFGKENSQAIIGIQMASAYCGTTFMPPLFGLIANNLSIALYPLYLALLAALILIMTETLNRIIGR
jgi:fucose permease